jgi:hypothetical protein
MPLMPLPDGMSSTTWAAIAGGKAPAAPSAQADINTAKTDLSSAQALNSSIISNGGVLDPLLDQQEGARDSLYQQAATVAEQPHVGDPAKIDIFTQLVNAAKSLAGLNRATTANTLNIEAAGVLG